MLALGFIARGEQALVLLSAGVTEHSPSACLNPRISLFHCTQTWKGANAQAHST